jgi:lambda repressor-like predicted transcriptional regulator
MNNAPYHSVLLEKPPKQSWRRVIAWLKEKGISFAKGSFKAAFPNLTTVNIS